MAAYPPFPSSVNAVIKMAGSVEKKSGSFVVEQKYWEAFYPGEFSDLYPNAEEQQLPRYWNPNVSLPVLHLSHITHNKQASSIRLSDSRFCFVPKQKFGKTPVGHKLDGSPMGTTFKKVGSDEYVEVPCSLPVLPGYFSWWGISCRDCYEKDQAGINFKEAVDEVKTNYHSVYEAGYLKNPPSSKYGNREFIFSLGILIESYKQSRKDCWNKDVYLRKAGTLHYRNEVCYVVMVVMLKDLDDSSILAMPSMFDEPCFEHNGCINQDGKLLNDSPPSFRVKRPFTHFEGEFLSWESLVFAFYFAKLDQCLDCPRWNGKEELVEHSTKICISKRPSAYGGNWVCPNDFIPPADDF